MGTILRTAIVAVVAFAIIGAVKGWIDAARWEAIAEERATEVARIDSLAGLDSIAAADALANADRIAAEADSIAADAQRERERVQRRVDASRDSLAIIRARVDSMDVPPVMSDLVYQYERVIENQDTIIQTLNRELESEQARSVSLYDALVAVELERDRLRMGVAARDRQIEALEEALKRPGLLPDGIVGQVTAFAIGAGIGMLAGG